jgi:ketosteroid isomerase-like protein
VIVILLLDLLIVLGLHKRVLDFFAAVDRGDKDEKSAAGDEETERAGRGVAFFVWWGC